MLIEDSEIAPTKSTAGFRFVLALMGLLSCIFMMVALIGAARAETAVTASEPPIRTAALVRPNDMNSGALLFPSRQPGYFVEAPKLHTDVTIDISGPILRARVTQRFVNPTKGWVEGTYVFPLPENSAVDVLKMQIGERFIEGKIKPREEARRIYEEAKASGVKAALLEQQRPNIFTNEVANIGPGETIVVQIEYQETIRLADGVFSFRFPMVVAPRYNPAPLVQTVDFNGEKGFAVNDPVPDRDKITAPVLDPSEHDLINPVSMEINLKAGFPIGSIETPSHTMMIEEVSDNERRLVLKSETVPANKDFEMLWKGKDQTVPSAGLFRETINGQDYLLAFLTPPQVQPTEDIDREVIFIIDNSGSMSGQSIVQARASLALAISRLEPTDRFNVIRFDDTMTVLFNGPVPASAQNRETAISYVRNLDAEGGTEMLPALKAALRNQGTIQPGAIRQVIFLTDGAIGNETELFFEINRSKGDARVFTVGIGSAPNTFFMTRAAEIGRGTFTHIASESQVAERMEKLFAKLEHPVLREVRAEFSDIKLSQITPDPIPDLYLGEPIVLTARIEDFDQKAVLAVAGISENQPWRLEMPVANAAPGTGIAKLWARRRIADLEADRYRAGDPDGIDKAIEEVAIAHHLVSRVTSLVAVDVTASRPADAPLNSTRLPLNLPEGWDFEAVFGEEVPSQIPQEMDEAIGPADNAVVTDEFKTASLAVSKMIAAAPSPQAAVAIAARAKQVMLPQTATLADKHILMGLLIILFALMSGASILMWRKSVEQLSAAGTTSHG